MPTSDVDIATTEFAERRVRFAPRLPVLFWLAVAWIGIIFALALTADLLALPSPTDMDMLDRRMPPSAAHWLGTDDLGRDVLSRLIWGAPNSLYASFLAVGVGIALGRSRPPR